MCTLACLCFCSVSSCVVWYKFHSWSVISFSFMLFIVFCTVRRVFFLVHDFKICPNLPKSTYLLLVHVPGISRTTAT